MPMVIKACFSTSKDVEGIIYTNDAQPTSWKDEGSEIQRLMKSLDEQREWGNKMRDEYLKIEQERDELKERVAQLEPKVYPQKTDGGLIMLTSHP